MTVKFKFCELFTNILSCKRSLCNGNPSVKILSGTKKPMCMCTSAFDLQGILFDLGITPGILGRGGGHLFECDHCVGSAVHGEFTHFLQL